MNEGREKMGALKVKEVTSRWVERTFHCKPDGTSTEIARWLNELRGQRDAWLEDVHVCSIEGCWVLVLVSVCKFQEEPELLDIAELISQQGGPVEHVPAGTLQVRREMAQRKVAEAEED